jgi:phosphoglycolate phosphatase-like HAD superfamily hydrolase
MYLQRALTVPNCSANAPERTTRTMSLQGVIFDLDGTLGDTLPVCFAAFRETFRHYLGREYSDREIRAMFGPTEEGIIQRMIPGRSAVRFVWSNQHA